MKIEIGYLYATALMQYKNTTMKNLIVTALAAFVLVSCNNTDTATNTNTETNNAESSTNNSSDASSFTIEESQEQNFNAAPSGSASGKLNPPHGEPGHRCEIPVGAPLDSEPSSTPTEIKIDNSGTGNNTQSITPTFSNTASTPTFSTQTQGKTATAPGMNPPHGEPGHDCAIPVGAPLKK